ncbi:hypothetical protein [Segetibacter aerophilus]|nr:hypothetical protein [Segetibacter aerophilus]
MPIRGWYLKFINTLGKGRAIVKTLTTGEKFRPFTVSFFKADDWLIVIVRNGGGYF